MAETGSFIPKQQPRTTPRVRRRRVYIVSYVIITFFLCVLLVAGGLFAWEWQLGSQLRERQTALNEQRERFSQSDILRIKEVEARLNTLETLLDTQPATSKVFAALNAVTLESVQIQDFAITPDTAPNTLLVEFSGVTDSFDTVLAQRVALQTNALFADAEVRDVQYSLLENTAESEDDGVELSPATPVQFSVSFALPMSDVMFDGMLPSQTAVDDMIPQPDAVPAEIVDTVSQEAADATSLIPSS